MPGTLYVVATPIGNLEDITLRALRVLREVHLIAAEDTRRTVKLLNHYRIRTPTTSLHEHNERQKLTALLSRLRADHNVALVSDAGTPGVSDPGLPLIQAAIREGIRVEPVPGPSALLAALTASGLPTDEFVFLGFPPSRSKDRKTWLESHAHDGRTLILFEAPHRIKETLAAVYETFGDRDVSVARELTKAHEEWVRGPISAVIGGLGTPKGEYTVVISGLKDQIEPARERPDDRVLYDEFCCMTENAARRRTVVSEMAKRHGMTAREVYAAVERAKQELVPADTPT